MQIRKIKNMVILLLLLAFFSVLGIGYLKGRGVYHTIQKQTVEDPEFRREFFSESMRENRQLLSRECKNFLENVEKEVTYPPIPKSIVDKSLKTSYIDGWMTERTYNGKRGHEGTDIMASVNKRGVYPVLSMTGGVITSLGWLEKGGYRVGITSGSGIYYYYAHLDSYANLKEGQKIKAGELLGYMGDSGYGPEGTKGQFPVHLHVGIYFVKEGREVSVNPYHVLRFLEGRQLEYGFSQR